MTNSDKMLVRLYDVVKLSDTPYSEGLTCTRLGCVVLRDGLYSDGWRDGKTRARMPQAYARPAGRILKRIESAGLVRKVWHTRRTPVYVLTDAGKVVAAKLHQTVAAGKFGDQLCRKSHTSKSVSKPSR